MERSEFQLTVMGARGSIATGQRNCSVFGGDSSCYMVLAGDETVFVDAGSGISFAPSAYLKPPVILLTHLHLDHIIGLGMFPMLGVRGRKVRLYVPFCANSEEAAAKLDRVFAPPFWPLTLSGYEGDLEMLPLSECLRIGDLQVEAMAGNHPGGCMVYKLIYAGKSIVIATDGPAAV